VGKTDLPFTLSVCVLKNAYYAIITSSAKHHSLVTSAIITSSAKHHSLVTYAIITSSAKHHSLVTSKLRTALQCRRMKSVMTWHFLILFCARTEFVYVQSLCTCTISRLRVTKRRSLVIKGPFNFHL
jgi:hypothetical protein